MACRTEYKRGCKTSYSRDSGARTLGSPLRRLVYDPLLVLCI